MSIDSRGSRVKPSRAQGQTEDLDAPAAASPSLGERIASAKDSLREHRNSAAAAPLGSRSGRDRAVIEDARANGVIAANLGLNSRSRPRAELTGLDPLKKVLAQVRALGLRHEATDSGYRCQCPHHRGKKLNFEVAEADDGRILLVCHAYRDLEGEDACTQEAVVEALGLEFGDLYPGVGRGDGGQPDTIRQSVRDTVRKSPPTADEIAAWEAKAASYEAALSDDHLEQIAERLGVDPCALRKLRVGWRAINRRKDVQTGEWIDEGPAWTFPERDAQGRMIGIQRRYVDPARGKKVIHRSRRGLYLPDGWLEMPGPIIVPEGASDVAAFLTAGRCAVGRPNVGGVDLLADLLRDDPREIVIAGENDLKPNGDWPGNPEPVSRSLSERLGRPLKHILPPAGFKDFREYLNHLDAQEGNNHVES